MKDKKGWWETAIISMQPNKLIYHGYRIEDLIGTLTYGEMVYLMIRGELPDPRVGKLMDALLIAGCDHGPLSPAVAAARMAATCGIPVNCSMATGINLLGDIHGGAGEQSMQMFYEIASRSNTASESFETTAGQVVSEWVKRECYIPGYGHPIHTDDPRVRRLFELGEEAVNIGVITGQYINIAQIVEKVLAVQTGHSIPINIDGVTASLECELGFTPQTAKGLFAVSRAIGILAHVLEESEGGLRLKGPMPTEALMAETIYTGISERNFPHERNRGNVVTID